MITPNRRVQLDLGHLLHDQDPSPGAPRCCPGTYPGAVGERREERHAAPPSLSTLRSEAWAAEQAAARVGYIVGRAQPVERCRAGYLLGEARHVEDGSAGRRPGGPRSDRVHRYPPRIELAIRTLAAGIDREGNACEPAAGGGRRASGRYVSDELM